MYVRRLATGHKVGGLGKRNGRVESGRVNERSVFTRELITLYKGEFIGAGVSIAADPVNNNESSEYNGW